MRRFVIILMCFFLVFLAACSSENEAESEQTYEIIEKEMLTPEIVIEKLCELGTLDYTLQTPGCNEVYNEQINLSKPVVKSYRITDNNTGEYIHLLCLASEEDAKAAGYKYDSYDYTKRLGAMFLFGSSACIDALSLSDYKYPESFEEQAAEEPDSASVEGIVKAIEDKTELCGGYYSPQTIAQTMEKIGQRNTLEGDILDLVHLTHHDGTVLRFVYIYEFESENDALLYEEDRTLFAQSIDDGVCVRKGNMVIYGNHSVISEII